MNFKLPSEIISLHDVVQCIEELQPLASLDFADEDQLKTLSARTQSLVRYNLEAVKDHSIDKVIKVLEIVKNNAPVFDVILATEPTDLFLQDLIEWFRGEIDEYALIKIEVRRAIAGGMVLRSRNRIYDFSFKSKLLNAKQKLSEVVHNV